jgi:hypothetical protein
MNSYLEVIPSIWDEDRDTAFFAITADVFSQSFRVHASVLLSGFDARRSTGHEMRELVPVPVRRLR